MSISQEALEVSKITRSEFGLLYQLPNEVQRAIDEKRAVIFYHQDQPAAFCFWHFWDTWCEIGTLYVHPDLRRLGLLEKMYKELRQRLEPVAQNAFVFTRHPVVVHLVKRIGFKRTRIWNLPWIILWKIIIHRLHPARLASYLKFGLRIFSLRFQLYTLQNTPR